MKKKINLLLAVLLSVSIISGCQKTNDNTEVIPEVSDTPAITQITPADKITSAATSAETTTDTAQTQTEAETEAATTVAETAAEVTTAVTTAPEAVESSIALTTTATVAAVSSVKTQWYETEISEVFYTSQACYSRAKAIVGSEAVKQYSKGTKVNVIAATDTGYYKLADGTFIHADYLTEDAPVTKAKTTTATTKKTTSKTTSKTTAGSTAVADKSVITTDYYVDYTTRYGYKTLNAAEKKFYANLVKAVSNLEKSAVVPDGLTGSDIIKVYGMVYYQEPQLFWMSATIPSGFSSVSLTYLISDKAKIQKMQNEIDAKAKTIIAKADAYSGTVSKVKVIYDYLVLNNNFVETGTGLGSCVYNALTGADGLQCAGYAKAFMYLCDLAGLESMAIPGANSHGTTHAWNKVYVDNGWYNIDATWGDPINKHDSNYIRYMFFLVPDSWIKDSHLNPSTMLRSNGNLIKYFTPPVADKTACNYFKIYGKEYSTFKDAEKAMYDEFDAAFAAKKNVVHIRVTDKAIYDKLLSDEYAKTFQKYGKEKGKVSSLARQRSNSEGVLVVQYDIFYN